ncbi:MAG: NUDIX domain-containing protein [Bacteroidota bacterium]|nr:NUDIX domain-containing protein [Bacteroidota bacterium]
MIKKQSAGILLYRKNKNELEVFLVHPGGPFWAKKEAGAWSIPKGEFDDEEDALTAAKRELLEETGISVSGDFIELQPVKLKSGKTVFAWAIEGDADAASIVSNYFEMEWPPHSGKMQSFPEIDKAAWFTIEDAAKKINEMQVGLLLQLEKIVKANS